jgi:hypothetical protein
MEHEKGREARWWIVILGVFIFHVQSFVLPCWSAVLPLHHVPGTRYLLNSNNQPVYLTGSHTWNNLQDSPQYDPDTFDYALYLTKMSTAWNAPTINGVQPRHNFIRLWTNERYETDVYAPNPFYKDAPGTDQAGYTGIWDFSENGDCATITPSSPIRFDPAYFARLAARVSAANDAGIYVGVMLFQGWSIWDHDGHPGAWPNHWFNPLNNCNSVDGSSTVQGFDQGKRVHTRDKDVIWHIQQAYIHKVVDTVNTACNGSCPNVLYEVANETGWWTTDWQDDVITELHTYEQTRYGVRHPVGKTSFANSTVTPQPPPGWNAETEMLSSPAEWFSLGQSNSDPVVQSAAKPFVNDTDHNSGTMIGPYVWRAFMRGHNVIYMDSDIFTNTVADPIRHAMGQTWVYANRVNLLNMMPQDWDDPGPSSTGYALYNATTEPYQYLVYQWQGGSQFTVSGIPAGTYAVEWFNVDTGQAIARSPMTNPTTFQPPGSSGGGWVLLLTESGSTQVTLTVMKAGSGSGTVTSTPAGITCGSICSAAFAQGTSVTLTASAASGSTFTGWSGEGCSGTGTCLVSMTQARTVTATFTSTGGGVTLSVSPTSVAAGGTVTATWSGIATPSTRDWIGLYTPGAANTAYIQWIYVSCSQSAGAARASGSCPLVVPSTVAPGTYQLRLLANNGFTLLATSNNLTVQ